MHCARFIYRPMGILMTMLLVLMAAAPAWAAPTDQPNPGWTVSRKPGVGSGAAVLMDHTTGHVLYDKNARQRRYPASTTKVMTALLLLEHKGDNLNDVVKISRRAAYTPGSSMGIRPGESYSLHDLLHGLMMRSGNDAAVAIAEAVAGSVEKFAVLMNRKAAEVGAVRTHFVNPHGLTDGNHYTTAYDLALITRAALHNETFRGVVSLKSSPLSFEQQNRAVVLHNTNRLLHSVPGADGVKTGTTSAAGPCLISSATRDGHKFIAVVLNAGDRWHDSASLLEWGFANFRLQHVARAGDRILAAPVWQGRRRSVPAKVQEDVTVVLPRQGKVLPEVEVVVDSTLAAPVASGQTIGRLRVSYGGNVQAEATLLADGAVAKRTFWEAIYQELLEPVIRKVRS